MNGWLAKLVLPVVLLVVTALASYLGFRADDRAKDDRASAAESRSVAAVEGLATGLAFRVQDVAGLFQASDKVTESEFVDYVRPVIRTSHAYGMGWAKVVSDQHRARYERRNHLTIQSFDKAGERVRAPRKDEYVVAEYASRLSGTSFKPGFDLSSTPERDRTLTAAAMLGTPMATPPVRFSANRKLGFALYMPVYGSGAKQVIGYTTGSFTFDGLDAALRSALPDTSGVELAYNGRSYVGAGSREGDDVTVRAIDIAGQTWKLKTWIPAGGFGLGLMLLVGGLLLTLFVTVLTHLILRSIRHAHDLARADAREKELLVAVQERKSAAAQQRFQRMFDAGSVGMALGDTEGRFVQVNPAFCKLVGRSEATLIGMTPDQISPPDDADDTKRRIRQLLAGEIQTLEVDKQYLGPNGEPVWAALRVTSLPGEDGQIEYLLAQAIDISARRELEQRLQHMADHDGLTGLPNRRAFNQTLGYQLAQTRRYGTDGALLVIDLDNFKEVNDLHGHKAGDVVLRRVADIIREQVRDSDFAGRIGGDEFAVLIPQGSILDVEVVARRLIEAIAEVGRANPHEGVPDLTCSIGVTLLRRGIQSIGEITEEADAAMYQAKAAGRNRFVVSMSGLAPARSDGRFD